MKKIKVLSNYVTKAYNEYYNEKPLTRIQNGQSIIIWYAEGDSNSHTLSGTRS